MSLPFAVVLQQLISSAPKPLRVNAAPLSGYSRVFSRVTFLRKKAYFSARNRRHENFVRVWQDHGCRRYVTIPRQLIYYTAYDDPN